jgi:hypothetical protein
MQTPSLKRVATWFDELSNLWKIGVVLVAAFAALGMVWSKTVAVAQMPAQIQTLLKQHEVQGTRDSSSLELLRQIRCGVLYETYRDKQTCIKSGQ